MRLTIRGNIKIEESCNIRQCQRDRWRSDGEVDTTDAQDTDKRWKVLVKDEDTV